MNRNKDYDWKAEEKSVTKIQKIITSHNRKRRLQGLKIKRLKSFIEVHESLTEIIKTPIVRKKV